jgi:hypothetical protein
MSITAYTPSAASNGVLPVPTAADQSSKGVARIVQWAESAQAAHDLAVVLCQTSFCPEQFRNNPGEATAAILAGGEVGLSPLASLAAFDIISGRAAARAITLRAVLQSFGHEIELLESTDRKCRMRGRRRGSEGWQEVTWTIERAQKLKLTGKQNWATQADAMLVARATSQLCRLVAADAILGIAYSAEELEDAISEQQPTGGRKVQRQTAVKAVQAPQETAQDDDDLLGDGEPAPVQKAAEPPVTLAQLRMLSVSWSMLGVTEDGERHEYTRILIGRDFGDTTRNLTKPEGIVLVNQLLALRTDVLGENANDIDYKPNDIERRKLRAALEKLISERAEPKDRP